MILFFRRIRCEGSIDERKLEFFKRTKISLKKFKDEEEIVITTETEESYEIIESEDTVTLILKSAKPEQSGNYFAQLTNEAGQANSNKAVLTVNSMLF